MRLKLLLIFHLFIIITLDSCSKRQTPDEIAAETLKGEWLVTNYIESSSKEFPNTLGNVTTFFDIEKYTGFYNAKTYVNDNLIHEIEGTFFILQSGKNIVFKEDGNEDSYALDIITLTENNLVMIKNIDKSIIYKAEKTK